MIHPYIYLGLPDAIRDRKTIVASKIISIVIKHFRLKADDVCQKTRARHIVYARHFVMIFLKQETGMSLKSIGKAFTGVTFDHTTVIHGIKTIKDLMSYNEDTQKDYASIKDAIAQSKIQEALIHDNN